MDLFQRLIFAGLDEQPKPIIASLLNELHRTSMLTLYGYNINNQINYAFLDMRNSITEGVIKGAEIYLNDIYLETVYFTNGLFYYRPIVLGLNTFKVRVFDDLGQFSDFSNPITYFLTSWQNINNSKFVTDYENANIKEGHFEMTTSQDFVYYANLNLMNFFVDFELQLNSGVTPPNDAIFTLDVFGNSQDDTTLIMNAQNGFGGSGHKVTLEVGKNVPNEYNKWKTSGVLGMRFNKQNSIPGITLKATFRIKDANNVESTWSYYF